MPRKKLRAASAANAPAAPPRSATNDTYAEGSLGHSRSEWFPTLLSAAVDMPADAARVCGDSAGKEVSVCGVY